MGVATEEMFAAERSEMELAASRLEPLIKAAIADLETDDYWKGYEPFTAWQDGFVNGMGGECSNLVGVITPYALVEILHQLRAEARITSQRQIHSPHLLAFARKVNAQIDAKESKR